MPKGLSTYSLHLGVIELHICRARQVHSMCEIYHLSMQRHTGRSVGDHVVRDMPGAAGGSSLIPC